MPAVSDPGYRLVRAAIEAGARVVPVPGPAALLLALIGSGLPTDRFFFAGFPPRKPGPRRALFTTLRPLPATLIFYESPHRVSATLADLRDALGDRPACVARELTKTHEEFVRGSLASLAERYSADRPLGEITLVVGGAPEDAVAESDDELRERAAALLAAGQSARDVAQELAEESGRPRREIYDLVVEVKSRGE
jgi:16S rRNA (cytidine1402-2'-O)-methyltransferase